MILIYRAIVFMCIMFPLGGLAQFTLPKVPADLQTYKSECATIAKSGFSLRRDIKYKLNDGIVTSEKYNDRLVNFDSEGKVKEFIYIDEAGRKKAIIVFEYYSNGLPKAEGEFYPTGEFLKRTTIKYTVDGQLIEKSSVDQYGNVIKKVQYSVDAETNTVNEKVYPFPSVVMEKNIWVYSSIISGKLIQNEKYDGESVLKYKRKLIYKNDQLIKEEYFNPAGNLAFFLEYTYNTENRLSQIEKVLLDETRLKHASYQYNSFGLLTGEIDYNRYGKMQSYYKYRYE